MSDSVYSKGLLTGLAMVVEMIEEGHLVSFEELAARLRGMYQGKLSDRDRLVLDHASAMHKTLNLPKNVEKGGWQDVGVYELLRYAKREFEEFEAALWQYNARTEPTEEHLQAVVSESSDVSNFLAMIVDNCKEVKP